MEKDMKLPYFKLDGQDSLLYSDLTEQAKALTDQDRCNSLGRVLAYRLKARKRRESSIPLIYN